MSEEVSKEIQEKFAQLQMMERNLQNFSNQRQMLQSQLLEVESAMEELDKSKEAYKIVGNIMVKRDKSHLSEELKEKQELLKKRVDMLTSQENKLRENLEEMQKDIMEELK